MRRWAERAITVVLLTACGESLPAPDSPDGSTPDAGLDASDASDADIAADVSDASVDVPPGPLCETDSSVVIPTGCAKVPSTASQGFVRCSTFDDDASPPNVSTVSNGTFALSSEAISPPNGVTIIANAGQSDVRLTSEVGAIAFQKSVLEADIRVDRLGTRYVLFEVAVAQQSGGTQLIELWVEPDGSLSAAASLESSGFADAGASAARVALCPSRWTHVKLELGFASQQVHIEVQVDGASASANLPSHISPETNASSAIGYVGVRAVEAASKSVQLDVDNMQVYVY